MKNAAYTPPPFPCSITVVQPTGQYGKTFNFDRKDWCLLGANGDCDIIVPFPGVAQLQAIIYVKRNGVFLQGIDKHLPVSHPRLQKNVTNEEEILLQPGDVFILGERKFLIQFSAENVITTSTDKNTLPSQDPNSSKTPMTATRGARGIQRRRRKSSLVVGEFDEKYVLPRPGTEKLLSKSLLARISQSELEILPEDAAVNNQDSISSDGSSAQDTEDSSPSSSSDDSTFLSDRQVSRNIDFSTIDTILPSLEGPSADLSKPDRRFSSRLRKDLVFSRLSKGLSATPRRGEIAALTVRTDAGVQKPFGFSKSEGTKTPTGKENRPQLYDQLSKSFKSTHRKRGTRLNRNRSPLSNRAEIQNQVVSDLSQRQVSDANSGNFPTQTPHGRSVAFARTIELAAGAHYSPFRPKLVANLSRSTSKARKKKQLGKPAGSSQTNNCQNRIPCGSPPRTHMQSQPQKYEQGPAPTSSLEGLGTFFYSKEVPEEVSKKAAEPVIEYEDDSNPPTPSSTEEGPETTAVEVPGPSPMARVGGALTAFLKRISGSLESEEEGDSSAEADETSSYTTRVFTEPQERSRRQDQSSCEPVMSRSELKELSRCMSPGLKKEFVAQVDSAAEDMRKAMHPVENFVDEAPNCSSTQRFEKDDGIQGLSVRSEEDEREDPSVSTGGDGNPRASETVVGAPKETPSDHETEKELEVFSTVPAAYEDSGIIEDSADLEIEELFYAGSNGMSRTDLRTEESEGDEIDYGDEVEEESSGSDDREVAAVVVDDGEDIVDHLPVSDDRSSLGDSDVPESKAEKRRELDFAATTEVAKSFPIQSLPDKNLEHMDSPAAASDAVAEIRGSAKVGQVTEAGAADPAEIAEETASKNDYDTIPSETPEMDAKLTLITTLRKELSRLKKEELKARLLERKLDASGLKKDLVERLAHHQAEEEAPARDEQSQEYCSASPRQGIKESHPPIIPTPESSGHLATTITFKTPSKSTGGELPERQTRTRTLRSARKTRARNTKTQSPSKMDPAKPSPTDSPHNLAEPRTDAESHTMAERSARKTRAQLSSKKSMAALVTTDTAQLLAEPPTEVDSKPEVETETVDLSLYRRRTVKELRQHLKDRGLDTQQKMRKEELIHHLVTLSIGSDGKSLSAVTEGDIPTVETEKPPCREPEEPSSTGTLKSFQRMTITQLRALLKERGQCQAGTKKALLERFSSQPERRTRSRRIVDATSCLSCQTGKVCEAEGKK